MATKTDGSRPTERKSRFSTAVNEETLDFIKAIEEYKAARERPFPSWTEVLQVVRAMGYRKVEEPTPLDEIGPESDD
jgi:hypothetical protein